MEEKIISLDTRTPLSIRDVWMLHNDKLTDFSASSVTTNLDQKVMKTEVLCSGFLVEHNLPLSTADHAAKLFKDMFPDSEIVNKYQYGRTKVTHMLNGAVAKQITSDLKEQMLLTRWYGLATNGTSDDDEKCLPVLLGHVDKDSGLAATSLLDIPNINGGSTAQQMYDVCNGVREAFSLDWNNYVRYSSDNTNSLIGQRNSLLQKIQKFFDVSCHCHLAHLCAGKGAKELSVNIEDFVIDIYYHFPRSAKRKNQLRSSLTLTITKLEK